MDLMNCSDCGTLMVKKQSQLCNHCEKVQREAFRKIKDCMAAHPWATVMEIQRLTGISLKTINAFTAINSLRIHR